MELSLPSKNCPLSLVIAAQVGIDGGVVKKTEGRGLALTLADGTKISRAGAILRAIARNVPNMYGEGPVQQTEVDSWIDVSFKEFNPKTPLDNVTASLQTLDEHLKRRTFVLGNDHAFTMADIALFGAIADLSVSTDQYEFVSRWFGKCLEKDVFSLAMAEQAKNAKNAKKAAGGKAKSKKKDQGNFVKLEGAVDGEVVVRFPPEASGFLHIGHAKAAMLNQYFRDTYHGKLRMRFDDTNPAKENAEFEKVILEDLKLLGIEYDMFSHTSDHFDTMMDLIVKMMKDGNAYVDTSPSEEVSAQRLNRVASPCREHTLEENLRLWAEMVKGSDEGLKCSVRAKIDFANDNGTLRDPTMYRCKKEEHIKTGTKYNVYPTYDFACPIVDSVEGVTHALRTTEYNDRDVQYAWIAEKLGLRIPKVWAFSRLNLINTVMSKRQLTWFVQQGVVDGWSDPRFPTVRGMLRQGMTVEGLKQFILGMGSSRNAAQMSWDKIWATNKKVIDPVAPRHTALDALNVVSVNVTNFGETTKRSVPLHPKNADIGTKQVVFSPKVLIEQEDAQQMKVGDKITLMEWGNAHVKNIVKIGSFVDSMDIEVDEEDSDYSKTLKVTWLADSDEEKPVKITAVEYQPLIDVPYIPKGEDIKQHVREKSMYTVNLIGSSTLASLRQGDIIQISRKGNFICDLAQQELLEYPAKIIYIPDGKEKTLIAHKDGKGQVEVTQKEHKELEVAIKHQKAKVIEMKKKKAEKADVKAAADLLKKMETYFECLGVIGGNDVEETTTNVDSSSPEAVALKEKITAQGTVVRELKEKKEDISEALAKLKSLKAEYLALTGEEATPSGRSKKDKKKDKEQKQEQKQEQKSKQAKKEKKKEAPQKGVTRLGMESVKEKDFPGWYTEVITKAEMIDYYDVSGCYVIRPWAYAIWELIHDFFDPRIKEIDVENAYFPIFVSQDRLEKEKDHIEDFAPEVAWVTRSGSSELAKPIAVRPTSETVMYPSFSNWVQSHRDLPIKINQWNNVVRWEFKQPTPFLRTREFLWQEGHTAHEKKEDAVEEVFYILDLYRQVYEDLLAIPVVPGRKTEKEKFAGGDFTGTVEAYIAQNGRAIQGATSHHLGQNFSKMFDISYQSTTHGGKEFVYQNSWGLTTRTIGVMVMVHSDNKGLVLPPRVASVQVVIIPIIGAKQMSDEEVVAFADSLKAELSASGVRAKVDARTNVKPGFKYNHWELRGVPLRLEVGPRDIQSGQFILVRRDTGEKLKVARDSVVATAKSTMDDIHNNLFTKAKADLDAHKVQVTEWGNFQDELNNKNLLLIPFCGDKECEGNIKRDSEGINPHDPTAPAMGAKSLCSPLVQPDLPSGTKCLHPACNSDATNWTMFGRSY
eukprot:m.105150 g.105150  ORF g.105150 m.105150 type:complete len:1374 (+) comp12650_c0_seq2:409-4530(+)